MNMIGYALTILTILIVYVLNCKWKNRELSKFLATGAGIALVVSIVSLFTSNFISGIVHISAAQTLLTLFVVTFVQIWQLKE